MPWNSSSKASGTDIWALWGFASDPRWAPAQRLLRGAQQQNLKVLGSLARKTENDFWREDALGFVE
jgi:hypothetical protein